MSEFAVRQFIIQFQPMRRKRKETVMEEHKWNDSQITVIDREEEEHLEWQVSRFEQFAQDMVISNDAAFARAGDLTR